MKRLSSSLLLILLLMAGGAVPAAQAADAVTATFSGTIRFLESPNNPVKEGFYVALSRSAGERYAYTASTDASGRFEAAGIAPGNYYINVGSRTQSWGLNGTSGNVGRFADTLFTFVAGGTVGIDPLVPFESSPLEPTVERVAGADRYESAVAVSRYAFAAAPVVFLASGENFPDGLSASAAAAQMGGPLLLTTPLSIPPSVIAELNRLQPARVIVAGGPGAIDDSVVAALTNRGYATQRVFGADRYATSAAIARLAFPSCGTVFIASGRSFADALSLSATAAASAGPLLLVDGLSQSLGVSARSVIADLGCTEASIGGGTAAVSPAIENELTTRVQNVKRFAGTDRYDTSRLINEWSGQFTRHVFVASGENFPDALAAAAAAGGLHAGLYLAQKQCIPGGLGLFLTSTKPALVTLVGGTAVLDQAAHPYTWGLCT
ncbi:cell wall-binding repeat-containing protein [Cryobacterium frigoriphilum]|uniref:Cell wall-binding repeat-containing protein n=1 Tax=Cryobacterium frigoriphilum TaxID=1259150 RepID=A0A4V3IRC6_9MICO|nr:cell wall-binding repeat-containing protein [Cryobacterium frigoriphilum]TFD50618.1 cell wall-binding repeat-containing protein [Cryobacterium frigoriphilum]